jgi:hypothetical protein
MNTKRQELGGGDILETGNHRYWQVLQRKTTEKQDPECGTGVKNAILQQCLEKTAL